MVQSWPRGFVLIPYSLPWCKENDLEQINKIANLQNISIANIGKTVAENIMIENEKIAVRELIHINEALFPRKFS